MAGKLPHGLPCILVWRERTMKSSRFFKVNEKLLRKLGRGKAQQFLSEMLTHGGRISRHQYHFWMGWILMYL